MREIRDLYIYTGDPNIQSLFKKRVGVGVRKWGGIRAGVVWGGSCDGGGGDIRGGNVGGGYHRGGYGGGNVVVDGVGVVAGGEGRHGVGRRHRNHAAQDGGGGGGHKGGEKRQLESARLN